MAQYPKDDFVNKKQATKLMMLGFNEPCIARFCGNLFQHNKLGEWYQHNSGVIDKNYISAPLRYQVLKWVRENYDLYVTINPFEDKMLLCLFDKTTESLTETFHDETYKAVESIAIDRLLVYVQEKVDISNKKK